MFERFKTVEYPLLMRMQRVDALEQFQMSEGLSDLGDWKAVCHRHRVSSVYPTFVQAVLL